ncbi:MAG: cyclophilin-like fold protein [Acutalibacteraceae bacterium]
MKKKFICFLSCLLLSFSLIGCSQENAPVQSETSQEQVSEDETTNTTDDIQNEERGDTMSNEFTESPVNSELRNLSGEKIAIHAGESTFTVELYDNPTANDLLTQLPLTLTANDYAGYDEKVIRLDDSLSMENAPDGDEPAIPEVGYYEPGNWIALYYGYIGYWSGKVPLGRIDASTEELSAIPDGTTVTIERLAD